MEFLGRHFSSGSLQVQRKSHTQHQPGGSGSPGQGLAALGDGSISGSLLEISSCCQSAQLETAGHSLEPRGSLGASRDRTGSNKPNRHCSPQ